MKNIIIKTIATIILLFSHIVYEICVIAIILQCVSFISEKIINALGIDAAKDGLAKIHLYDKETGKVYRPCNELAKFIIKFYKHDFNKKKEEA